MAAIARPALKGDRSLPPYFVESDYFYSEATNKLRTIKSVFIKISKMTNQ